MKEQATCQSCGASLEIGAPDGLCPACLLGGGLFGEESDEPDEVDVIVEKPGDVVGRYRLLEKIGEGGFGVVFRAEQQEPVRRVVALKVIKPGMDSKQVIARFEAERQALALMDHPNISKIYDAGTTEWGRPYFVMEYVEGRPLTVFCDEERLDLSQRLKLFSRICTAVQHAHQKGVIHRDLKPSNILVCDGQEGDPFPKIIDFGVAKSISMELTKVTFYTLFGRLVGTPQYMSPEQAELNAVDVDTRSDIYTLGVILYELVTGCAPLEDDHLLSKGMDEMRRMIREEEPLKPSTRIFNTPVEERRAAAKARRIEPGRYRRQLLGDLDWIVMKALEKDRNRRYDTAHGLALDVRRYLKGLPVSAGPPGTAYRFRKFVRRHRVGAIATVLALLALMAGTTGISKAFFMIRAEKNQTRAEKNQTAHEHLKLVVEEVRGRQGIPGSRGEALDDLKMVGNYDLSLIGLTEIEAQALQDSARNELIACLDWKDLQRVSLCDGLDTPWVPAALDAAHERCVLFVGGRLEVRETSGATVLKTRAGSSATMKGPLSFSPDGSLVAAGFGPEEGWELEVWNWKEDRLVTRGVAGVYGAFDFDPKGNGFAIGTRAGRVEFRGNDGAVLRGGILLPEAATSLRFSHPDGRFLAVGMEGAGVAIFEVATGEWVEQWEELEVVSLAWAPDGRSIVAGGAAGTVTLLERGVRKPVSSTKKHGDRVDHVAWSHDGRLVASGSQDGVVVLWDGGQGELLCEYAAWARSLSFSNDDARLGPVTPATDTSALDILEVKRAKVCHRARGHQGEDIRAVAWTPDGTVLVTAAGDGVRFWNREGVLLARHAEDGVRRGGLVCSSTAVYLVTERGIARRSYSVASGSLVLEDLDKLSDNGKGKQIQLSPDETVLAVAADKEVLLLDPGTGAPLFPEHPLIAPASTSFVAFSPGGQWLAAGTEAGDRVRVWPLKPSLGAPIDLPIGSPATVAFYPLTEKKVKGKKKSVPPMLLTGDASYYRLWIWKPKLRAWSEGPQHESRMANRQGRMAQMEYSPRGTVVVTSFDRRLLQVLHPTKLLLMSQPGFAEQWPLKISPDGRLLATEAANGRLFIWNFAEIREEMAKCGLDWSDEMDSFVDDLVPLLKP